MLKSVSSEFKARMSLDFKCLQERKSTENNDQNSEANTHTLEHEDMMELRLVMCSTKPSNWLLLKIMQMIYIHNWQR
jgi:hypothetical protein